MQRVFAVVCDPMDPMSQLLLGSFTSESGPRIYLPSRDDIFNTNHILFSSSNGKDKCTMFVGASERGTIFVGSPGDKTPSQSFSRAYRIDLDNAWGWKDSDEKVWIATEPFGRYLSYLAGLAELVFSRCS